MTEEADEPEIESGITLPPSGRQSSPESSLWKDMAEGDSVFFPDKIRATRLAASSWALKDPRFRATQRKVEGGFRVWKVLREPKK